MSSAPAEASAEAQPRPSRVNVRALMGMGIVVSMALAGYLGLGAAISWWNQATLVVSAALTLLIVVEGRRHASEDDQPFRSAVVLASTMWFVIQAVALWEHFRGRWER